MSPLVWHSQLTLGGCHTGAKTTNEPRELIADGDMLSPMHLSGTLSTTLDGRTRSSQPIPRYSHNRTADDRAVETGEFQLCRG